MIGLQLVECVEDGGYLASVHAVDEQGDLELEDPEMKASKVCLFRRFGLTSRVFESCRHFNAPEPITSYMLHSKVGKAGGVSVESTDNMLGVRRLYPLI